MAGGGADLDRVRLRLDHPHRPAERLLGVVARLAEPLSVDGRRLAAGDGRLRVVVVPDRGVAPRRPADPVAQSDEPRQPTREAAAARVQGDQLAGGGAAVEPAQVGEAAVGCGRGQLTRELGRDRAVAREVSRGLARAEQHLVAHDQLDLDRHHVRPRAHHPLDQGVGHDLAAGAAIARGPGRVGGDGQGPPHRHALCYRQLGGQPGHRVGHGPQGHPPRGLRHPAAQEACGRVELGRHAPCGALDLPVAHRLEAGHVTREATVHGPSVPQGQAGRLADQHRRLPLRDATGAQGASGARHLVGQDPAQPDVETAATVRLAPGEGDLRGHAATPAIARDPRLRLPAAYGLVEPRRDLGLEPGRGAGQAFERPDHRDPRRVVPGAGTGSDLRDPLLDDPHVERRRR